MHKFLFVIAVAGAITLPLEAQETVLGIARVDSIDLYGLHQVSDTLVRQALGVKEGDPLPASKIDAEERLLDINRVVGAKLEAVCCDEGKTTLYVGIEERGAPSYEVRPAPSGAIVLPDDLLAAYDNFEKVEHAAELAGKTGEDLSQGHSLMNDPAARAAQMRFPALVQAHLGVLRDVLNQSNDEFHRGLAAYLLPYAIDKASVVEDLHVALSDDDPEVRTNAIRGLTALSLLGRANPASRVRVPPAWFLPLLQSIVWTDRTQAVWGLEMLTKDHDAATLAGLRGDALASLIEMSRWHSEKDAYPAFTLVGRVTGLSEFDIRDAWLRNGVESTITKAKQVK